MTGQKYGYKPRWRADNKQLKFAGRRQQSTQTQQERKKCCQEHMLAITQRKGKKSLTYRTVDRTRILLWLTATAAPQTNLCVLLSREALTDVGTKQARTGTSLSYVLLP